VGHALETAALLKLERSGCETAYVRTTTGFEVDFLARGPEGDEHLIQVCAEINDPQTLEREVRALKEATPLYPRAGLHLVTLNPAEVSAPLPKAIHLHAAVDWLLDG